MSHSCTHVIVFVCLYYHMHAHTTYACSRRACFRTRIEGEPCAPLGCTAEVIPRTNFSITFQPDMSTVTTPLQSKIWSPGKVRSIPRDYQNNRICQYHLACPQGHVLYFGFREGNFDLEPEQDGLCPDFVLIEDLSSGSFSLCGSQQPMVWFRGAPSVRMEFRSNTDKRFPGFQFDALCVRPEFADLPDCDPLPDDDSGSSNSTSTVMGRRKRSVLLTVRITCSILCTMKHRILVKVFIRD